MVEKWLKTAMGAVNYLTAGRGPTLLFFHGGIATPRAYEGLINLLSADFTVIAPTHPGHGSSFPITDDWSLAAYLEVYKEFCSILKLNPAVIVGHSFGGTIALLLAQHYPASPLIVMNGPGLPLTLSPKEFVSFMAGEAQEILRKRPDLEFFKEMIPATGTMVYTIVRHPENLTWMTDNLPKLDISEKLAQITNPVLLLWGEKDSIVPMPIGKAMAALLPHNTFIVLSDEGHVYPVTEPELAYKYIKNAFIHWGLTK